MNTPNLKEQLEQEYTYVFADNQEGLINEAALRKFVEDANETYVSKDEVPTLDYAPKDTNNTTGFWAGLLVTGKTTYKAALDKLAAVLLQFYVLKTELPDFSLFAKKTELPAAPKYYDDVVANAAKTDGAATPRSVKEYVDSRPMTYAAWKPNTYYTPGVTVSGPAGTIWEALIIRCGTAHTSYTSWIPSIIGGNLWSVVSRPFKLHNHASATTVPTTVKINNIQQIEGVEIRYGSDITFTNEPNEWLPYMPFVLEVRVNAAYGAGATPILRWDPNIFQAPFPTLPEQETPVDCAYSYAFDMVNTGKFVWVNQPLPAQDSRLDNLTTKVSELETQSSALTEDYADIADRVTVLETTTPVEQQALRNDIDILISGATITDERLTYLENNQPEPVDLEPYALKSELPNVDSFITFPEVDEKLIPYALKTDLFSEAKVRNTLITGLDATITGTPTAADNLLSFASKVVNFITSIPATIRGTLLVGLTDTAGNPAATDSVLTFAGKVKKLLADIATNKADKTDARFTDARTPLAHSHQASDITGLPTYSKFTDAISGYAKATVNAALAVTDTLLAALGKLEKKTDDNKALIDSHDANIWSLGNRITTLEGKSDYTDAKAIAAPLTGVATGTDSTVTATTTLLQFAGKFMYFVSNIGATIRSAALTGGTFATTTTVTATDTIQSAFNKVAYWTNNFRARVRDTDLTGVDTTATATPTATDTFLSFAGKVINFITATKTDVADLQTDLSTNTTAINLDIDAAETRVGTAETNIGNLQTALALKANLVTVTPTDITPVSNVLMLDYDPAKPYFFATIAANTVVQLSDLVNDGPGVGLTIEKTAGTEVVTFQNGANVVASQPGKTLQTAAGTWDEYYIQKTKDRFKIAVESYGKPTVPPAPTPTLADPTGFRFTITGALQVTLNWDASPVSGVTTTIRRATTPTGTVPTIVATTNAITSYVDNGPTASDANAKLVKGNTYYYRIRFTKSGYLDSQYVTIAVTIP